MPKSPVSDPPEPDQELHRQRLVEAVGALDDLDRLGGRVGRHHGLQRVARREIDQRKTHDADAERDRDRVKDAPQDVFAHVSLRHRSQGRHSGARALSGRLAGMTVSVSPVPLRRDRDRRQVLEPALRLHEPLHLRRHRARVQIVRDKDQRRLLVHHLVQPGQQREPLRVVELGENLARSACPSRGCRNAPNWRPSAPMLPVQTCRISALNGSCVWRLILIAWMSGLRRRRRARPAAARSNPSTAASRRTRPRRAAT